MKQLIFTILLGIITYPCQSQEINNIGIGTNDYSDFEFLKEIIGDKKIICLGEEDHWFGEYFQLKNKLIQFLIDELDFSVVVFESSGRNSILTELSELELSERVDLTMNRYWKTRSIYELMSVLKENKKLTQIGVDMISSDETVDAYINEIQKILFPIDSELFEEFKTAIKEIANGQYQFQAKNKHIDKSQGESLSLIHI